MEKKKKTHNLILLGIIVMLIISSIIFFVVPFPYTATEHRITREPYTYSYRECVKHSWWDGSCTEYDTRYVTDYREKSYDIKVTKYATLFQMANNQVQWYYEVRE